MTFTEIIEDFFVSWGKGCTFVGKRKTDEKIWLYIIDAGAVVRLYEQQGDCVVARQGRGCDGGAFWFCLPVLMWGWQLCGWSVEEDTNEASDADDWGEEQVGYATTIWHALSGGGWLLRWPWYIQSATEGPLPVGVHLSGPRRGSNGSSMLPWCCWESRHAEQQMRLHHII